MIFAEGRFGEEVDPAPKKKLKIRIISGQHLPKSEQRLKGDIIEPYVKVRVRGFPDDEAEYVTKVIPKVRTHF